MVKKYKFASKCNLIVSLVYLYPAPLTCIRETRRRPQRRTQASRLIASELGGKNETNKRSVVIPWVNKYSNDNIVVTIIHTKYIIYLILCNTRQSAVAHSRDTCSHDGSKHIIKLSILYFSYWYVVCSKQIKNVTISIYIEVLFIYLLVDRPKNAFHI